MNELPGAGERIASEVASWPGVEAVTGNRGELSLRVGKREIGHLHGDHAAHFGLPKALFHDLHGRGQVDFHPVFPGKPGFAARKIETEADVEDVIEIFGLNYDRVVARYGLPVPG